MRNLKKILALVLALVMSLSLMATASAGSFQDVTDDNPYKTAIDVLDQLKVFQGFEDGSFKPTDTLNRAQAAVLVYRIATGDVEGKQVDNYTYMAQSKFTDLDGYNWAKGYINYCQNAGIVVGTDATHFNPGGKVTGYQLLVMLLRTLGYGKAGEFADPKGWELQTASIAEREGITKYITGGDFGAAAPRQMVAEILFRGLLTETVTYSALTSGGYTKSGETLGKRELDLEDVKGVVMANEFADLEDDDTLADDKTRLVDADGKVYNLDVSSELTDVGEIRHAYVQNGTKVLTTLEDLNDSTVNQPENGKGTKVKDLSKTNGDTQYFLNFGENDYTWTSDWKIKYVVNLGGDFIAARLANADQNKVEERIAAGEELGFILPAAYDESNALITGAGYSLVSNGATPARYNLVYTQEFKIHEEIGADHQKNIKLIFDIADKTEDEGYITGEVYAGTTSRKDLSDEMTRDDFIKDYIIDSSNKAIDGSDNGEWLKTIDNDGDGVAEYVFLTTFVMSVIDDYNTKTETYYVEYDADSNGTDRKANDSIKKSDIVTEDELNVGDVILYTWIDGKCYVSKPEVDTAAIDKKGINYKAETITCGDTTYEWSGIEQEAYHYYHDVSEAQVEVNYDLYKDHFGYVRLFAEANKGFVLLTDGFYATDLKKEHTYKAEIWDDAAEELAEVDLANNDAGFIDRTIDNSTNREEGTWDRLNGFDVTYRDHVEMNGLTPVNDFITNIAAYDVNSDGAYNLDVINSYTGRYWYGQHELDIDSFDKGSVKDKDLDIADRANGNDTGLDRINATDETLYYYVQYKGTPTNRYNPEVDSVTTWTGYSNGSVKLVDGDRAYAVTRAYQKADNSGWVNYETAEIIVIEHQIVGEKNIIFPTALNQRLIGTRNLIGGTGFAWGGDDGKWILDDFDGKYADQDSATVTSIGGTNIAPVDISDLLHFYEKQPDGSLLRIDADYNDYDIYAGVIVTEVGTVSRLYGEIGLAYYDGVASEYVTDPDDLEPEHDFYKSSDNFYTIGYDRAESQKKDEMLHIPGFQYDWLYGNVAATFDANGLDASKMKLGDLVLYVTDGDGVVQSIINVTKSEMSKNYDPNGAAEGKYPGVYEDDPHTVDDNYPSTSTLLTLWKDIAAEQNLAAADTDAPTVEFYGETATAVTPLTVEYKDAADNKAAAEAAGEVFNKLTVKAPVGCTLTLVQFDGATVALNSKKTEAVVALDGAIPTAGEAAKNLTVVVSNGEDSAAYNYTLTLNGQDGKFDEVKLAKKADAAFIVDVDNTNLDTPTGAPTAAATILTGETYFVKDLVENLRVLLVADDSAAAGYTVALKDATKANDALRDGTTVVVTVTSPDYATVDVTITVTAKTGYVLTIDNGDVDAANGIKVVRDAGGANEEELANNAVIFEGDVLTIGLRTGADAKDKFIIDGVEGTEYNSDQTKTVGKAGVTVTLRDYVKVTLNNGVKITPVKADGTDDTEVTAASKDVLKGSSIKVTGGLEAHGYYVVDDNDPTTDDAAFAVNADITIDKAFEVKATKASGSYTAATANDQDILDKAVYFKYGTAVEVVISNTVNTDKIGGSVPTWDDVNGDGSLYTYTDTIASLTADKAYALADNT